MRNLCSNYFYFVAGIIFLLLAKVKHSLEGYKTPKPFGVSEVDRCVEYDIRTVNEWIESLDAYVGLPGTLVGKNVLELGPGSDLGSGLTILSHGAQSYSAIDVNNLIESVPMQFYECLFDRLQKENPDLDANVLKNELMAQRQGVSDRLKFHCRPDFNILDAVGEGKVDVVFSQAAFEHFDDVQRTIQDLSAGCSSNAVAVISVDLQTHSRWIRDKDPNNIYRYPDWLYNKFYFKGTPNRIRPYEYKELFEKFGWQDVTMRTLTKLDCSRVEKEAPYLADAFRADKSEMGSLSVLICARRSS
ncbi:MAG: methyltransferase domain-containing protein [Methylobacter sp.]|nr:methyltransferase domain-containing protein [Methylobacter sp.]